MPVAFLDLAQQCAPQIATETIAAVISVESGFHPFAIRINTDRPLAEQPKTRAEAIETATALIAEGHDIDLGLGGINSGNLGRLGLSVSDAFDFCLNIKASAALLDGYYQVAFQDGATKTQAEAVMLRSYFGSGDPLPAKWWVTTKEYWRSESGCPVNSRPSRLSRDRCKRCPRAKGQGLVSFNNWRQLAREGSARVSDPCAEVGCLQCGAAILRPRFSNEQKE